MLPDLQNRTDIEKLIDTFYSDVKTDPVIGHFFNEVIELDWDHHIPLICDFWESVLFATGGYRGNVIKKHIQLDRKSSLEENHFQRWLELFNRTVDQLFAGLKAEEVKTRADLMAKLMRFKIDASHKPGFVA